MNDSLIKQLELAIAVIKGEIPHDEIECRHERNSNWDKKVTPINSWEFHPYEYRRKPKPLECEVVVIDGQIVGFNGSTPLSDELRQKALVVKMKEVL